jgi:hydroxymethylbilane synthase
MKLDIGTRGSTLALWQTKHVIGRLTAIAPGLDVRIEEIKTQGDLVRDRALWQVEGRGFFVKEIENALLSGQVDLAVHSLKDVPTESPAGLTLGAILERADPHDALLARKGLKLSTLPHGALVGTSSLRRRAQLLAVRPDLQIADLRGNVDTRLRKLQGGEYDAIILAVAGLERLELSQHITQRLPADVMLPAPAQGALGLQCRADDAPTLELLRQLNHRPSAQAVRAERAFLNGLSSGCSAPVAAYAQISQGALQLRGLVASLDGSQVVRVSAEGAPDEPEQLGQRLAQRALEQGARAILESIL